MTWTDAKVDAVLHELGAEARSGKVLPGEPAVSPRLAASVRWGSGAAARRRRFGLAAVAVAAALLLMVPTTLLAMGESVLGIQVRISDLSLAEWTRQGVQGWLASPGEPEWLSPAETAQTALFPIRTPGWVPDGYVANGEPRGAYPNAHSDGRWTVDRSPEVFFVSQGFQNPAEPGHHFGILQQRRPYREGMELNLAPGTEQLEVAGHPAFMRANLPMFKADTDAVKEAARTGMPPVAGYQNELVVWVAESDGTVTQVRVSGTVDLEVMVKVAESLFR